jgi:hypothetical protein
LHLIEITEKNVALVEGIICQIIEPDMQQTASYLQRVVDKEPKKALASLYRHNVRYFSILRCTMRVVACSAACVHVPTLV